MNRVLSIPMEARYFSLSLKHTLATPDSCPGLHFDDRKVFRSMRIDLDSSEATAISLFEGDVHRELILNYDL
jgi:hypothetical protein